jgi:hypothetical protein
MKRACKIFSPKKIIKIHASPPDQQGRAGSILYHRKLTILIR